VFVHGNLKKRRGREVAAKLEAHTRIRMNQSEAGIPSYFVGTKEEGCMIESCPEVIYV
jgi:hypothetical protein